MAIKKVYLKTKSVCKVTFETDAETEGVFLVGDFNDWDTKATPLKKLKKGGFKVVLNLDKGKTYRFRYLNTEGEYFNEVESDSFEYSDFAGAENCILNL